MDTPADLTPGLLREVPLASLLSWARESRATGCLRFSDDVGVSRLYLVDGQPAGTLIAHGHLPLPQLLLELGWLDDAALDRAMEQFYEGVPIEDALVKTGGLAPEKLEAALAVQEERHLRSLADLGGAAFDFVQEPPPAELKPHVTGARALIDALAAPGGHARAQAILERLSGLVVRLKAGVELAAVTGQVQLQDSEKGWLEALQPGATLEALARDCPDRELLRALIAALLELGLVEPVDPVAEAAAREQQAEADRAKARQARADAAEAERSEVVHELIRMQVAGQAAVAAIEGLRLQGAMAADARRAWRLQTLQTDSEVSPQGPSSWLTERSDFIEQVAQAAAEEAARVAAVELSGAPRARVARHKTRSPALFPVAADQPAQTPVWWEPDAREEIEARAIDESRRVERFEDQARERETIRVRDRTLEAEAQAKAERERLESEALAKAERERLETEAQAKAETERLEAEAKAKAETERLEAEAKAKADTERLEAEAKAKAETERLEAEAKAKAETERLEAEAKAKADTERLEAEAKAKAETERLEAEAKAKAEIERLEAEAKAKAETERLEAEAKAKADTERLKAEAKAKAETERLEAEAKAKAEIERLEAEAQAERERARLDSESTARRTVDAYEVDRRAMLAARDQAERLRQARLLEASARAAVEVEKVLRAKRLLEELTQSPPPSPRPIVEKAAPAAPSPPPAAPTIPSAFDWASSEASSPFEPTAPLPMPFVDASAPLAADPGPSPFEPTAPLPPPVALHQAQASNAMFRLSDLEAQDEIQRHFDQQARLWLEEEHSQKALDLETNPDVSGLVESVRKQLVDGLTSDLETLLASSLQPRGVPAEPMADHLEFQFTNPHRPTDSDLESLWDDDGDDMGNDEEGRARRLRLRRMGMQNTGILSRPSTSPGAGAEPPPVSPEAPAKSPITSKTPAAEPAPTRPGSKSSPNAKVPLTSEERSLGEDIEKRYVRLGKDDHFARMGLPRTAASAQVKSAFVVLAQRFHPDKLPAGLSHLKDKGQAVFEGIRESYEALVDDGSRITYLDGLKQVATGTAAPPAKRGPAPEALLEAKKLRSQAEMSIRRKLFVEAEQLFAKAAAITQSANDVAGQAWARYLDPARPGDPKVAELLRTALTMDPRSDRAQYVSGVIARAANDLEAAERHFKNALSANPEHADSALELRLLARRRDAAAKKGLFGR